MTLVAVLASFWIILPTPLKASTETTAETLGRRRFRIELFSGFALLNSSDLNLFVDCDNRVQEFNYDIYFNYLRDNSLIQSWSKDTEGERKKIKNALPFGIRVRYSILNFLAVSIGFEYFQRHHSNNLDFRYSRDELSDEYYRETLSFSPYELSVRAFQPSVGIHIFKRLNRFLTADGFVSGGPLFTKFNYESTWNYLWIIEGPGYSWETYESNSLLGGDGTGTGISLEAGGRLSVPILRKLEVFLEGGYTYQVVKSLSGSGREVQAETTETWNGEWGVMTETLTAPWGTLNLRFPTNLQMHRAEMEDFSLDLSGFRIRIGLSFEF
jgi:hypothetical protein